MKTELIELVAEICRIIESIPDRDEKIRSINNVRKMIHNISPLKHHPVDFVEWVKEDNVFPNDYNPNFVATKELTLLKKSIIDDGFTMSIPADPTEEFHRIIVDGFHRFKCGKTVEQIKNSTYGYLPLTNIREENRGKEKRMASTIRHNRARGKHDVELQAQLVVMLKAGWDELRIMKELGMTLEEVQRLIGLRGIASEIKGVPYSIERQIVEVGEDVEEEF